ncbi:DNRLRE domain-containing protein [bacterium]|nr:DNRLRE domain-containing protein [bacterium]
MRTLTVLLFALVLTASAATVTFQPDPSLGKDAHVFSLTPDSNHGDLSFCNWGTVAGYWYTTYIEFTELNDFQYQGATVYSATLFLYVRAWSGDSSNQFVGAAVHSYWDEDTITWNNRPGPISGSGTYHNYPAADGWMSVDITDWVRNWLDGTWTNNGFYFRVHSGGDGQWNSVRSSDYTTDPSLRPALVMSYSGVAVEEATWGQIKAGI